MMFRFQVDVGNTSRIRQEVSRRFGFVEVSVGYAEGNGQWLWKKFGMVTGIREQQLNYTIAKSKLCLLTDALILALGDGGKQTTVSLRAVQNR